VPGARPGLVPRRDLLARLVDGEGRKLTLLCAPAGWGKTVLLSEWHASAEELRPFAWVSLDRGDDDVARFWGYVIGALRTVAPDLGRGALAGLPAAGPGLVDTVVGPLINELAELPSRLVLVLDDYHLVREEPIHASVGFLLRHLPDRLHLAIASRSDPPLPLGALRASGEMLEVRAAELRFSDAEADALLNGSLGLGLDMSEVELLQARTEGWAAGLQLAALSLRGQEDKHALVETFAGDDRQIGDYLHEVLAEQPAPLREFLLRTSILERLCAPLCDALTGGGDGAAQLEAVDRSNLFLVPLDTRREWYRYHHLFRDLLRHELTRAAPGLAAELHRRASVWHRAAGDVDEAIAHATAAGDFGDAGELIARHWRPVWNLGQRETVARWIDALPRAVVLADPRLCLARGWTALFLGRFDEVEPWTRAAELGTLPGPLFDGTVSVEANAALLRCTHAYFRGDVRLSIEEGRRAVALDSGEASPSRAVTRLVLALPLYFAGDLSAAGELLEEALRPLPGADWAEVVISIFGRLACVRADAGELERAERAAGEAERLIEELRLDELPSATVVQVARGKLHEQRDELVAAEAAFDRAVVLARRGGRRLDLAHALLLLARLKRRRRQHGEARRLVREARQVLAACPDPATLAELLAGSERALQLAPSRRPPTGVAADPDLSERELTILGLLATELSQREIGAELYISLNTVKGHTRSIFRKLGVATRAEAVARGRALGLL
jgi:LuxR family maltose regulon positive regulatory protein